MASQTGIRRRVEWPTVLLLLAFAVAWLGLLAGGDRVPWPVQAVALVYLGGLWMSLGHELLHGHPTRWNWVNSAIGWLPLSMWVPFSRYKTLHVQHHTADLTDPIDDPESFYVTPAAWRAAGPLRRRWLTFQRTIVGRFTVGVPKGILRYWLSEARRFAEVRVVLPWMIHAALVAVLAWWLFGVVGMNPWLYVFAFCFGGSMCTNLRAFAEHNAVAGGTRSAVVKAGPVMSLLFLNNNLHHTHHAEPNLAWYRIPARHLEMGSDAIAAAGAGLYEGGYWEVVRRYFVRPYGQPEHPLSAGASAGGGAGIA